MVSKLWTQPLNDCRSASIENLRVGQIDGFFRKIFNELSRMQALAIYSRLLVSSWSAVSFGKRLSSRSSLLLEHDDGACVMFFLLRLTFWLGLVLVLLPREKTPESEKLPQIGASEAVQAATAAVSDMSQFCKRQPAACEVGGQAATVLGARAQEGARRIYQIITDKRAPDHTSSIGGAEEADPDLAALAPRDTLTDTDLAVEWRGAP
jgi:hypothetical protein